MNALELQRKQTQALIDDDPTTVSLIPTLETTTPAGAKTEVDGDPRAPQTFKLSLLAFDQRPTVTLAGVARVIDYHLIARWDAVIEVGDHWTDEAQTTYTIVGFSEGWNYMKKAFVERRVGKNEHP